MLKLMAAPKVRSGRLSRIRLENAIRVLYMASGTSGAPKHLLEEYGKAVLCKDAVKEATAFLRVQKYIG
jgi:hypothetical protein